LAKLTTPRAEMFKDDLLAALSRPLAKKVLVSLKSILREAQRTGAVAQNVAASVRIKADKRSKRTLESGVDIPLPSEVRSILHSADGKRRALLAVAAFAGLRSSELRGLRWADVDLDRREIAVRQRADRYGAMGAPKSEAGKRVIPFGPFLANTLKEWKLACPKTDAGLVFPTSRGRIDHHANILRGLEPIMVAAGVTVPVVGAEGLPMVDAKGAPVVAAKYALHAFRHFFASWCINRKEDGGLGLPPKVVQERMGHSSITMTMDTYGHLFPRGDDGNELAEAEARLLA
jgi:integrase